jgi:hypothetical protein
VQLRIQTLKGAQRSRRCSHGRRVVDPDLIPSVAGYIDVAVPITGYRQDIVYIKLGRRRDIAVRISGESGDRDVA